MDKMIVKRKTPLWKITGAALLVLAALWLLYSLLADASIRTYRVPADQVTVSTVSNDTFQDVILIRGTVQPLNSVFLDAFNGGVVEEVFVTEGSFVEQGTPLIRLSNSELQLNVSRIDTSITEQLNNLGNISNSLEATTLNTEREVIDLEYRIQTLEHRKMRLKKLIAQSFVSHAEYQDVVDELNYQNEVLENTRARQQLEKRIRNERRKQIDAQVQNLEENLEFSRSSYESLMIRAPITGQLTSLSAEIGENKTRGERLARVDAIGHNKISAQVDEYYVARILAGQTARFNQGGDEYAATVEKVYSEVTSGTFEVELHFQDPAPANLRRGQTVQLQLMLGASNESLLLPVGGFVQSSGGNWVFVLGDNEQYAFRRDIRIGRRNNRYIEIHEGLHAGDKVITSSYSGMQDVERIELQR